MSTTVRRDRGEAHPMARLTVQAVWDIRTSGRRDMRRALEVPA